MGMYSTFVNEDIRTDDWQGLKTFLDQNQNDDYVKNILKDDGTISFRMWNEWKIEGYWYKEMVEVLKELAKYIEGEIEYSYEEGYNFKIIFEAGKVYYLKGQIVYDQISRKQLQ